jgi:hypothetical protein
MFHESPSTTATSIHETFGLKFCAAMGTVAKMFLEGLTAPVTIYSSKVGTRGIDLAAFVSDMSAPFTFDKWLTLTNSQNGDEKERQIIIHAYEIGLT